MSCPSYLSTVETIFTVLCDLTFSIPDMRRLSNEIMQLRSELQSLREGKALLTQELHDTRVSLRC